MKEVDVAGDEQRPDAASFAACVATILELPFGEVPQPAGSQDPATGWEMARWLGGNGLGLAPIAEPASFSWAGPWVARILTPTGERRSVVMYGVPSDVVWDPSGATEGGGWTITDAFLIAPTDVALALPPRPSAPTTAGIVEGLWVAAAAGEPARARTTVLALAGKGLGGDRGIDLTPSSATSSPSARCAVGGCGCASPAG